MYSFSVCWCFIHCSHGPSRRPPHSKLETISVPFGSKITTDFDAPDADVELYEDDFHAPDVGMKIEFNFKKSKYDVS